MCVRLKLNIKYLEGEIFTILLLVWEASRFVFLTEIHLCNNKFCSHR